MPLSSSFKKLSNYLISNWPIKNVIEFTEQEITQIKVTLTLLADYSKRHDEILTGATKDLTACQQLISKIEDRLGQELRNRSKVDLQIADQLSRLPQAYRDIAILQENQQRSYTRMNIIMASFWSAIAVIIVGIIQMNAVKPKAQLINSVEHVSINQD
jgi:hypothetical protein